MQLFNALILLLGSCLFFIAGSTGQEDTNPSINANIANGRFFFGDPCNNSIYQFLGITDAKCSKQCYFQAGYQNGGFCDDNNTCQCNTLVTDTTNVNVGTITSPVGGVGK